MGIARGAVAVINDRQRFRLRSLLVLGVVVWLVLLARLVEIQMIQCPSLTEEARCNHCSRERIPARRGDILDRDLEPLAQTVAGYAVKVVPQDASGETDIVPALARTLGLDPGSLDRRTRAGRPFFAKRDLLLDDGRVDGLCGLDGVYLEREHARVYPRGALAAHVVGFTDPDNTGLEGAELEFDSRLAGIPGWVFLARDARGRGHMVPGEFLRTPQDGCRVILSLDLDCQAIAEEEIRCGVQRSSGRSGQVLVMDPRTGDILALAVWPGYDPNDPGRSPREHRRNRAITDYFEPGSTFKIVALAAAIRKGVVEPDMMLDAEQGCMQREGFRIRDHHPYGTISFREAVEHSSNICFAKIADLVGEEALYEMARDFGVGCPTGVRLPGETSGLLRPPKDWSRRSLATIAIGQEVGVSALQLANMAAAVANGGVLMTPRIVLGVVGPEGRWLTRVDPKPIRRVLSEDEARETTEYLVGVVENGTGQAARLPGLQVAGKTGTAQKAGATGYAPDSYVASFVGYLPAHDPVVLVLVVVDEPQNPYYGGDVAAPVFRRIVERMITTRAVGLEEALVRCRVAGAPGVRVASIGAAPSSDGTGGRAEP